jgi:hypothetical protein
MAVFDLIKHLVCHVDELLRDHVVYT